MKFLYRGAMYESILLESYTSHDIIRIYGDKLKNLIASEKNEDPNSISDVEVSNLARNIENADPSVDKKWLGSIANWLLSKRIEDLDAQIKPDLIRFKQLLEINPGKFGVISKAIAKGKYQYTQLKDLLSTAEGQTRESMDIESKVGDFEKVAESQKYVMYLVDKWIEGKDNKHFCFSGNVDWCVKYKKYFDNYEPPYYYILSKDTGTEYALMHLGSQQLKNTKDNPLTDKEFEPIANLILPTVESYLKTKNDEIKGDFKVIIDYSRHNSIEEYPTIKETVVANRTYDMFRLGMFEDVLEMINEGYEFDFARISSKIMHFLATSKSISGRLITEVIKNPTFDVNAEVYGLLPLILAAKSKNKFLVDELVNSGRYDFSKIDNLGYNVFSELGDKWNSIDPESRKYIGVLILKMIPADVFNDDNASTTLAESNHEASCAFIINRAQVDFLEIFLERGFEPSPDWLTMTQVLIDQLAIGRISNQSLEMLKLLATKATFDWSETMDNGSTLLEYIEQTIAPTAEEKKNLEAAKEIILQKI